MKINLCDFFELPQSISCVTTRPAACDDTYFKMSHQSTHSCMLNINAVNLYSNLIGARSVRDALLGAIANINMPLKFNKSYRHISIQYLKDLICGDLKGLKNNVLYSISKSLYSFVLDKKCSLAVVHWRRGDQTTSFRCQKQLDVSANCGTAINLINTINEALKKLPLISNQERIVYVATNEAQDSVEMNELRKMGYKTYSDILPFIRSNISVSSSSNPVVDELTALYVDSKLMLQADEFLAWGISEIDDIVEFERMKLGKRYCTASNATNLHPSAMVVVRLVSKFEALPMSNVTWCSKQRHDTIYKDFIVDPRRGWIKKRHIYSPQSTCLSLFTFRHYFPFRFYFLCVFRDHPERG